MLLLIAHIAGHRVAFDTASVESVVDIDTIVPVPQTDGVVRGLFALRSRVITVIDTALALGLVQASDAVRRAVISQVDGHAYALAVDMLDDVAEYAPLPLTAGMRLADGWAAAVTGYVERDGEAVLIVNPTALVSGSTRRSDLAA